MSQLKIVFLATIALLVVGCAQEEPTPEPTLTAAPTHTPQPTATAVPPTETPEPTETPLPTATPEPTATPVPASSLIETGDTQLLLSDWQGAEDAYRQAIENEPENALAHSRLSYLLQFHPESYAEAVDIGREAVALAPNDPVIVSFLIMTLTRGGHYEEALGLIDQIELLAYNEAIAMGAFLDLHLSVGDYDEAEQFFQFAISISAFTFGIEEIELNRIFTKYFSYTGNRSSANQYTARLAENAPAFAPAYFVRSQVRTPSNLNEKTQRDIIVEGLILDPDYLPLMVALAENDAQAGSYGLAMDSCDDVTRLFPSVGEGLLCKGNVFLAQGLFEEGQLSFEAAVELDSEDHRAYIGLGRVLIGLEDCETAESNLLTALEQQPYAIEAYAPLAESHLCQDENEEAEAVYAEALALRPFDSATNFSAGKFYFANNDLETAEEASRTAIMTSAPGNTPAEYFAYMGMVLVASNHCAASDPPELAYYACTGDLFLDRGSLQLAVDAYSLALEIDGDSISALEGTITAYANVRFCDVAEPLLDRLREITTPSDSVTSLVATRCAGSSEIPDFGVPIGERVTEDEAIALIATAVDGIDGIDEVFVFFDNIDSGDPEVGEVRVLLVQFITNLERGDSQLNRQISELVYASIEGFVLADSDPLFLIVQARLSLIELPEGFVVNRFSSIAWYNEVISNAVFRQTWTSFEEISEQAEQQGG